mmetsp:Transcript_21467/g.27753  ORF Transcript_21467/g.27753 Transcript_21467/m.27753 type:complete len:197 (+) Transcript_21467:150-740(+)
MHTMVFRLSITVSLLGVLLLLLCSQNMIEARNQECEDPCVAGDEEIMHPKAHGTSSSPVQNNLRWGCSETIADRMCNFNRHYAENAGYWEKSTSFVSEVAPFAYKNTPVQFFDSNTGKLLFTAPISRSWDDFLKESKKHGWPSFRDNEVNWDQVRVLPNGETVSVNGTHLGHNLPDGNGRRYCINLVSIAGRQIEE